MTPVAAEVVDGGDSPFRLEGRQNNLRDTFQIRVLLESPPTSSSRHSRAGSGPVDRSGGAAQVADTLYLNQHYQMIEPGCVGETVIFS